MQNSHLESPFADVIIQRGLFDSEKERQFLPMVAHIVDRLAQTGIWFDLFVIDLLVQPTMQLVHQRAAVGLMKM